MNSPGSESFDSDDEDDSDIPDGEDEENRKRREAMMRRPSFKWVPILLTSVILFVRLWTCVLCVFIKLYFLSLREEKEIRFGWTYVPLVQYGTKVFVPMVTVVQSNSLK